MEEGTENTTTETPTPKIPPSKATSKKNEDKKLYKVNLDFTKEIDQKLEKRMNQFRHILTTGKPSDEPIKRNSKNFATSELVFRLALSKLKTEDLMEYFLSSLEKNPERKLEVLTDCYNLENKSDLTKYEFVMQVWPSLSTKPEEVKKILSNRLH